MNEKEIKELLKSGETETLEFKQAPNDAFYKTISGMANTKGGIILLGTDNKGSVTGVDTSTKFLEDLTNRIVNKLSIYPGIETANSGGKRLIAVKVARSTYPVSYEGRYYERVGNTTRAMDSQKLQAFMLSRTPWDSTHGNFALDEMDAETVDNFLRLAVGKKRLTDVSLNEPQQLVLQKLGLIVDGKFTNGALLLFGKNPQKHFVNLCVRIGRFKTETIIIDDKWAKGNLFQQFEQTINILRQFIAVRYEIEGLQREDIWDYPIPALREAVLNALTHRDYFNIANFITIKVYDDHIWFYNLGKLVEGITIEQLKKPHQSYLRNPLIAKVFYLCGFLEQYGSGTVRMVEWMKSAGLPEPEYKEEMGGFSVYFYRDIYTEENLRKMGLTERQIKAVMYVKERGKITNMDYQEIAGVSKPTATRDLTELVDRGIFDIKGKGKRDIHYTLSKSKMSQKESNEPKMSQKDITNLMPNKRLTNASKGSGRDQRGLNGTTKTPSKTEKGDAGK